MPKPKFQQSFDLLDDDPNFHLKAGKYVDLRFVLKGTLKTGETLDLDQIGDLTITRNGNPLQVAPAKYYSQVESEWNAPAEFTNVQGGEFRLVFYVPFHLPELVSATPFASKKGLVRFDLSNGPNGHLTQVVDSGRLRVTARSAAVPFEYLLHIAPNEESYSGRVSGEADEYSEPNIVRLWFEDPDDIVTAITISQDERNLAESQTLAELGDDDTHDNANFAPTSLVEYSPIDNGGDLRNGKTTVRISGDTGGTSSKVKTTRMYLTELSA